MRFMMGMVLLLVMGLITTDKALAQVKGVTQVKIGVVSIDMNNRVTVNFTMELDSTMKSFAGINAITEKTGIFGGAIPNFLFWPVAPTPGGGPVSGTVSFAGAKGTEYKATVSMMYKDATNTSQTTSDAKTFTP